MRNRHLMPAPFVIDRPRNGAGVGTQRNIRLGSSSKKSRHQRRADLRSLKIWKDRKFHNREFDSSPEFDGLGAGGAPPFVGRECVTIGETYEDAPSNFGSYEREAGLFSVDV